MPTLRQNISNSFKKVSNLISTSIDLAIVKSKKAVQFELSNRSFSRKAIATDVDLLGSSSTYVEKGSLISFEMLRQLGERDMIVVAIVGKLTNRVAAFAQPQKDKFSLGFRLSPNLEAEGTTDETKLDSDNKQQKTEIAKLIKFLLNTGIDDPQLRPKKDRYNFETFLRLIVNDRLIYNQIGVECIATKDKQSVAYFVPVSGGSIRFVAPQVLNQISNTDGLLYDPQTGAYADIDQKKRYELNKETEVDEIMYAQVHKGQIYAVFTDQELIYKQGIPSVDLAYSGYAPGELERLINTVSSHRIAESHNERFFRFGYGSNGILNIKSDVTEEDLQALKRQFQRQYQGVKNAFKMPILASKDGIEFITTGSNNRDMEWGLWMEYLIKIMTAVYGISPAEINFDISRGTGPSLSDSGKHNEVSLKDTKNSLLQPLLRWIESIVNDEILPRYDVNLSKKYVFEFVGLDADDQDVLLDRIKKKVTTYLTVNEVRKEEGIPPLGEEGNIILDPVFAAHLAKLKGLDNVNDESDDDKDKDEDDKSKSDDKNKKEMPKSSRGSGFKKSQTDEPQLVKIEYWGQD